MSKEYLDLAAVITDEDYALPASTGEERGLKTVISLRTHQITIERRDRWYMTFSVINRILLLLCTLALLSVIALSIFFAIVMLDNLHVIDTIRTQPVPGITRG